MFKKKCLPNKKYREKFNPRSNPSLQLRRTIDLGKGKRKRLHRVSKAAHEEVCKNA